MAENNTEVSLASSRAANAPSTRFWGITIANGYSPEARVFATLLKHRGPDMEALVTYQYAEDAPQSVEKFEEQSRAQVIRMDFGWRPNKTGKRPLAVKVRSLAQFYRALPGLLKQARAFQPDIIYSCQQKRDCQAATYVARHLGKPQIIHLHYIIGPWLGAQTLARLKTCDHIITVSDFIRAEALAYGIAPERVTSICNTMAPMPIPPAGTRQEIRAELGIPLASPLIGYVGRFDPGKGHDDTLAAFVQVSAKYPDAHLVIVGSGVCQGQLEALADSSGVRERIHFTGRRTDVPRLLAAFDIFSHPSRKDPAPLAVLEACASGLPVVAYAEGGVCEFVVSGQTGLLSPPGEVAGLAASFETLLSSLEAAREMGAASRRRIIANFQPAAAGEKFQSLVRALVPSS